ncbi:MAG: ASKHA domain-containing protein [Thermodesulfovibrionales bacterium]
MSNDSAPLIFERRIAIREAALCEGRAQLEWLEAALGLSPLTASLPSLRRMAAEIIREESRRLIIGTEASHYRIIDVSQGRSYSIALDLGTTNIVASIFNNMTQNFMGEMQFENPQISVGEDVLTRMQRSMYDPCRDVQGLLVSGVNDLIGTLCATHNVQRGDIHGVVVSGNTVMSHFFLGLDVGSIPVYPHMPVVKKPGFFLGQELSLEVHPEAVVYVFPNAGSYVGGDIVSGILASGLAYSSDPCVLIDVGTNAEVVLGNKDWLLVGAGAAGPALERGIVRIGRRAAKGVIYDVEFSGDELRCKTIDGAAPEGICGSGMVSLVYELFKSKAIDERGVLAPRFRGVRNCNGDMCYDLACGSGKRLSVAQTELQSFLKSKAAMFALLRVLVGSVGLEFRDIRKVFVAGALGNGINSRKACGIGMLPSWPPEIVRPIGNSSLRGACMLLEDGNLLGRIESVADRITYRHIKDDPEFTREFLGASFIPHTNPDVLKV